MFEDAPDRLEKHGATAPSTFRLFPGPIAHAEAAAAETGDTVETAPVRLGLVSEPAMAEAFAREFDLPLASAADLAAVPAPLLPTISPAFPRARRVLPLAIEPGEAPDTQDPIALTMSGSATILPDASMRIPRAAARRPVAA